MKKLSKFLSVLLVLTFLTGMSAGCGNTKSFGYFTYIKLDDDKIGLTGLTSSGQEQETLVIPQYLDGKEVVSFDKISTGFLNSEKQNKWFSTNLKKIFITFPIRAEHNPFSFCGSLKKTILIPAKYSGNLAGRFVGAAGIDFYRNNKSRVYYPFRGTNNWSSDSYMIANISYMWNYKWAPNEGFYWVDDENYGVPISWKPSDPERKDYTFDGWYREAACITPWDFDSDTLPEEELTDMTNEYGITAQYPKLQQTILYAKWNSK